ncbi:MAG: cytochrome c [Cyanobacteria bacterium J06639_1]
MSVSEATSARSSSLAASRWLQIVVALAICAALVLVLVSGIARWHQPDTYVRTVLATAGDVQKGRSLFALNCAGCHGSDGLGRVGPSLAGVRLRRSDISIVEQVTSGNTPPMPQFQAQPEDMAALLSYLKTL